MPALPSSPEAVVPGRAGLGRRLRVRDGEWHMREYANAELDPTATDVVAVGCAHALGACKPRC